MPSDRDDAVDELRRELRASLDMNLTPAVVEAGSRPVGEDNLEILQAWNRRLVDGGWAAPSWPVEHGGRGAGVAEQLAYLEEMNRVRAPGPVNVIGVANIAPAIMHFGTDEHRPEEAGLLLVGAEVHDRRRDVGDADDVDRARRPDPVHLLQVGQLLGHPRAPSAVLDGPRRRRPTAVDEPAVPRLQDLQVVLADRTRPRPRRRPGSGSCRARPAARVAVRRPHRHGRRASATVPVSPRPGRGR